METKQDTPAGNTNPMVVGAFDVWMGKTLNQVVYYDTGLDDGEYTLIAVKKEISFTDTLKN